jgi:hypothetical protein
MSDLVAWAQKQNDNYSDDEREEARKKSTRYTKRKSAETTPVQTRTVRPRENLQESLDQNDTIGNSTVGLIRVGAAAKTLLRHYGPYRIISTHPDGHCLRRAIGKVHGLHPGKIVYFMRRKCENMILTNSRMKCRDTVDWYSTFIERAPAFELLQNNIAQGTTRDTWGGTPDIQLWALITKKEVHVLDTRQGYYQGVTIYQPTLLTLPYRYSYEDYKSHYTSRPQSLLLYNGNHFNAIAFQGDTPPPVEAETGDSADDEDPEESPTLVETESAPPLEDATPEIEPLVQLRPRKRTGRHSPTQQRQKKARLHELVSPHMREQLEPPTSRVDSTSKEVLLSTDPSGSDQTRSTGKRAPGEIPLSYSDNENRPRKWPKKPPDKN